MLQDGAALVGVDLMRAMVKMIREKKLSRQEIACRIVDLLEAKRARLPVLRERLGKLNEPQEEATRFRVERENYDLEHESACGRTNGRMSLCRKVRYTSNTVEEAGFRAGLFRPQREMSPSLMG
jgi:hypothetical protein